MAQLIDPAIEEMDPNTVYLDPDGELWLHDGTQFRYVTDEGKLTDWDTLTPDKLGGHFTALSATAGTVVRTGLGL